MEITLRPDPDYTMVTMSRINRANIGKRYHRIRLKDISEETNQRAPLLDYVAKLPTHVAEGHGLILQGTDGTGKTAAACRLLMEVMARGPGKTYFCLAQNIDHYAMNRGETVEGGASIWGLLIADAQLVVIDDLGAERKTEWISRWVELVLTERYARQLPTIITTNPPKDAHLFDRYPRLRQLSQDAYDIIEFNGPNWRG